MPARASSFRTETCFHVVYIQHVALKRLTFSNSERTGKIVTEENVAILSL